MLHNRIPSQKTNRKGLSHFPMSREQMEGAVEPVGWGLGLQWGS